MEDRAIGLSVDDRVSAHELTAEALCQTYAGRVYKFAQLISTDSGSAEDMAQDALERAIRGLKNFDPAKGEVESWLWRIVVNAGRDAGRIAGRRRPGIPSSSIPLTRMMQSNGSSTFWAAIF